jgi:hypothetical protein
MNFQKILQATALNNYIISRFFSKIIKIWKFYSKQYRYILRGLRMRAVLPRLPQMSSWCDAYLIKHKGILTFQFTFKEYIAIFNF